MARGRHNGRGKFCNRTSLWKWNTLWISVPRSHPSQDSHPFNWPLPCSSQRNLSLSNYFLQQNTKENWKPKPGSQDEVSFWKLLLPSTMDKLQAEQQFPSDLGSEQGKLCRSALTQCHWRVTLNHQTRAKVLIKLQGLSTLQKPQDPPALIQSVLNYSKHGANVGPDLAQCIFQPSSRLSTTITDTTDYILRALPLSLT